VSSGLSTVAPPAASQGPAGNSATRSLRRLISGRSSGLAGALIVLLIGIRIKDPLYFTVGNIEAVLLQMSYMAIIAIGTTFLMIAGEIDLSIGSQFSLFSVIAVMLAGSIGTVPAIILTLIIGALIGLFNGVLVRRVAISPLIITLGLLTAYAGVAEVLTSGNTLTNVPRSFVDIGQGDILTIPSPIWVMVVIAIVATVYLSKTNHGALIFMRGGNNEAAKVVGLNIRRLTLSLFVGNGVLVAIAAIITASQLGGATPDIGVGLEFTVITGVILGGVGFEGGIGSIPGTILGVAVLTVVNSAVVALGVSPYWADVIQGGLLLVAVILDQFASEGRTRRERRIAMRENAVKA
jgi:ribose transport system permease protein